MNITQAPGGGIIANDVVTYLPQCSALTYTDVNADSAAEFDLTDSDYLVRLLPSIVPGLFFGILSLLGLLFFSLWLCSQCGRRRRDPLLEEDQQQFISSSQQSQSAPLPPGSIGAPQQVLHRRRGRAALAYKVALLALAAALAGVSAWGLADSISATNRTVSDFWDIVRVVDGKVDNTTNNLEVLGEQLGQLSGNVSALSGKAPELITLFDAVVGYLNSSDLAALVSAASAEALNTTAAALNSSALPGANATEALSALNATAAAAGALDTAAGAVNASAALAAVDASLAGLSEADSTLVREGLASAVDQLLSLPESIDDVQAAIVGGLAMLQDDFNKVLSDMQSNYEKPTLAIQERWRFIPIAVVFGTTIAAALVCGATFWGLRWYRSATAALVVLWLDIALLMFLGVGLLRSLDVVTSDTCLYGEYLSMQLAQRKLSGSEQQQVLNIFSYYYGLTPIPDDRVVYELMGVPTYKLHEFVYGPILPVARKLAELGSEPQVEALLAQSGLQGDGLSAVDNVTQLLPALSQTVRLLEGQSLSSSVTPLYHQVKEYLCCSLANSSSSLWTAWTVAGTLGFALAALCSARIAAHTLDLRRHQRKLAAAAAAAAYTEEGPLLEVAGLKGKGGRSTEERGSMGYDAEHAENGHAPAVAASSAPWQVQQLQVVALPSGELNSLPQQRQ